MQRESSYLPTMSMPASSHRGAAHGIARRILRPFDQFVKHAAFSGMLLFASAVAALVWANSPASASYVQLWSYPVFGETAGHWVNDGFMTLFFLLVGLEIKREILVGELASVKRAALPLVGAMGGMIVPAVCFALIAKGTPASPGWGIPMATDIAFALGVVTLLGSRVPPALKVFLVALAIVDDIGAVLVIALFYTADINVAAVGAGGALVAVLLTFNRIRIRSPLAYLVVGALLWFVVLRSGVHATIAGVLLAMTIPADGDDAPLLRIERALHAPISYGVMPLFAFANAGIQLPTSLAPLLSQPAALGTAVGLIFGKPIGILGATFVAVRLRIAELPAATTLPSLVGVALLGGIGFTMSLFIAALAFRQSDQLTAAKLGVLGGSLVAGALGSAILLTRPRPQPTA